MTAIYIILGAFAIVGFIQSLTIRRLHKLVEGMITYQAISVMAQGKTPDSIMKEVMDFVHEAKGSE